MQKYINFGIIQVYFIDKLPLFSIHILIKKTTKYEVFFKYLKKKQRSV